MKVRFVFPQSRIRVSCFFSCILYMYNHLSGEDAFQSVIQATRKKFKYSPNKSRTYEVLVTGTDALPLSYRRRLGAKATKLGSRDKHPAYCKDCCRTSITHRIRSNTMWMILCPLIETL